tara:strand:- start:202 stop:480 length:279 start_codon:yes stop_codon:yes gene_type:complete
MSVQITIQGRQYTIRTDQPDEDLHEVARYIDGKMDSMKRGSFDSYTIAILAALNVASEYKAFRTRVGEKLESLDKEAAGISAVLDAAIPGST